MGGEYRPEGDLGPGGSGLPGPRLESRAALTAVGAVSIVRNPQ
jgi:hypothetical protein